MTAMTESIQELIRVLQLTSPTEESGAFASSTGAESTGVAGGFLPGTFAAKVYKAKDLVSQTGWSGNSSFSTVILIGRVAVFDKER